VPGRGQLPQFQQAIEHRLLGFRIERRQEAQQRPAAHRMVQADANVFQDLPSHLRSEPPLSPAGQQRLDAAPDPLVFGIQPRCVFCASRPGHLPIQDVFFEPDMGSRLAIDRLGQRNRTFEVRGFQALDDARQAVHHRPMVIEERLIQRASLRHRRFPSQLERFVRAGRSSEPQTLIVDETWRGRALDGLRSVRDSVERALISFHRRPACREEQASSMAKKKSPTPASKAKSRKASGRKRPSQKKKATRTSPARSKSATTDESVSERVARHEREYQALISEEQQRHSALLADLESTQVDIDQTKAQLREAISELGALDSRLQRSLTERDQIEEALRKNQAACQEMLQTGAQGVIRIDSRERIVWVNALACEMFGYSRAEMLKRKLGALLPRNLRRIHSRHVEAYLRNPTRRPMGSGRDLVGRRKDGRLFPIEVGLSVVDLEDGLHVVAFVSDITERKRVEAEVLKQKEQLQNLNAKLVRAAEESNRQWARELHDDYGQRLVAIAMKVAEVTRDGRDGGRLRLVEDDVRRLAQDIQRVSRRMHPTVLHDLGLRAALKQELMSFGRDNGLEAEFRSSDVPEELPDEVALAFYRIAQEALGNIRKHSRAKRVRIEVVGEDDALQMLVQDQGDGFRPEKAARRGGLGLVSMEERARAVGGEFSIESTPRRGTGVRLRVPLKRRR
jgi:PAS domain S-box-containing protein